MNNLLNEFRLAPRGGRISFLSPVVIICLAKGSGKLIHVIECDGQGNRRNTITLHTHDLITSLQPATYLCQAHPTTNHFTGCLGVHNCCTCDACDAKLDACKTSPCASRPCTIEALP